jgi:hypothetical protein
VTKFEDAVAIVGEELARELLHEREKARLGGGDGLIMKAKSNDALVPVLRKLIPMLVAELDARTATGNREALGNRGSDPERPLSVAETNAAIKRVAARARQGQWR